MLVGVVVVVSGAFGLGRSEGDAVKAHYVTFETPSFTDTTFDEVKQHLLDGRPIVITDGARGLPMAKWDCDFVRKEFPHSRIRQEGGNSEVNSIKMSGSWTTDSQPYPGSNGYPDGAPRMRPYYWDIAKAYHHERDRKWGKHPKKVVQTIVSTTQLPYWLPEQSKEEMGQSSEMWFHPKGAGARAHMDPHCKTTVSFCFSGQRKWRMMLPPDVPHPEGYFDGEVYGVRNTARKGEWQPTFETNAPNGSAVIVYPGMIHETLSIGDECSSSISQLLKVPAPAAYYRAFWPRFALMDEDVGNCGHEVEALLVFDTDTSVRPAQEPAARTAGKAFAAKIDRNGDGNISEAELLAAKSKGRRLHSVEEHISFHDTNRDGAVSAAELEESWVMFATANHRAKPQLKGRSEL